MKIPVPAQHFRLARVNCYTEKGLLYNCSFSFRGQVDFEVEDTVTRVVLTPQGSGGEPLGGGYYWKNESWKTLTKTDEDELKKLGKPAPSVASVAVKPKPKKSPWV